MYKPRIDEFKNKMDPELFKELGKTQEIREAEDRKFEEEWHSFWNKNHGEIGQVLIAHLVVEYYLEQFLIVANPSLGDTTKARLSFRQKVELVCSDDATAIVDFLPSLMSLNALRNKFSHNLHSKINDKDIEQMLAWVESLHTAKGYKIPKSVDVVIAFAKIISQTLYVAARLVEANSSGFGLRGYKAKFRTVSAKVKNKSTDK